MQPVGYDRLFGGGLAVLSYIQDITQGIINYRHSFFPHLSHLSVHTIFTLKSLTTSYICMRISQGQNKMVCVAPPTQGTWRSNDYVSAVRLVDLVLLWSG